MSFEKSYPPDIQKIIDAGFQVVEKSPWHHHIYHGAILTNIWHTTKKYMRDGWSGATVYEDVSEVIKTLKIPTKEIRREMLIRDETREEERSKAAKEVESFHERLRRNLDQAHQDRIKRKMSAS